MCHLIINQTGIYSIKNILNEKIYVGQSVNIHKRWIQHRSYLNRGLHNNLHLQRAWNKYGESIFLFSVLEICTVDTLDERESWWIKTLNSYGQGYNQSTNGYCQRGGESYRARSVVCLNTGETFSSITEASESYNISISSIQGNCIGRREYCRNLITYDITCWAYHENYVKMSKLDIENVINISLKSASDRVVCLNTGEEFKTLKLASCYYKINDSVIIQSCKNGIAGGCTDKGEKLLWKYKNEYNNMSKYDIDILIYKANTLNKYKGRRRSVVCLNTKMIFPTASQAMEKYPSADKSSIHSCCKGDILSAGKNKLGNKLIWRYYEDYSVMSNETIRKAIDYSENWSIYNPVGKKVICKTTNEIFNSCKEAIAQYYMSPSNLNGCLKGRQHTAGKHPKTNTPLEWAYY